uniref:Uncharacterized protein n=1 Tax=Anguilla anguilla TaxID=7936 RepID=A0A0E9SMB5_ANGAN
MQYSILHVGLSYLPADTVVVYNRNQACSGGSPVLTVRQLTFFFYIKFVYAAGYLQEQFRLSTMLSCTTAVSSLGFKPAMTEVISPAP